VAGRSEEAAVRQGGLWRDEIPLSKAELAQNWDVEGHLPRDGAWGSLARREEAPMGRTSKNHGGGELRPAHGRG
jgi:hypothetical protein